MPESSASPQRFWRHRLLSAAFGCYAVGLLAVAHRVAHHLFDGWLARAVTMGVIALGLLPWARWLGPRLARALEVLGRWLLIGCYFTLLVPFAIVARLAGDPLRRRRGAPGTHWIARRPLPNTLDAARLEY